MSHAPLQVGLAGIGLIGPGLPSWPAAQPVLLGQQPYNPAPTQLVPPAGLPPAERRRTGPVVKVALAAGLEAVAAAGANARNLATVFSASGGDGHNCHQLCETLASDDRQLSPTRFHNSVHNAAAGYWSIATGAMAPSSVLCAYDASLAAGLLEAAAQVVVEQRPVLLICYDADYPEPLRATRPIPDAFGLALLLTPAGTAGQLQLQLSMPEAVQSVAPHPVPGLENLRGAIPAARGLPLLTAIAAGAPARVVLDYLEDLQLQVNLLP